eukprot:CAMPEP_0118924282 /NCGR_PEP_ID=MMETSP1169-20130426/2487_1 /TAXON_ID=36882 /ORGANISM="Pyramimonas obovata, Strain CCMP722" /LENGTH=1351 /DNA_ID=CAMNT_0006865379 /DNA_START=110 /DNA_END=4165 /DNA_ORIENTATION=+
MASEPQRWPAANSQDVQPTFDADGTDPDSSELGGNASGPWTTSKDGNMSLKLKQLPQSIALVLGELDADGDGTIDLLELQGAVNAFKANKKNVKMLRKMLLGAILMMLIGTAAMVGLVYTVIVLTKETHTGADGIMRVAFCSDDTLVRVGNAEQTFAGSTMVTNDGRTVGTRQAPLQPVGLSSTLPNAAFDELKVLKIEGENSAFLSLTVLGWIRIPPKAGIHGSRSTIKIITHPGHILVDGSTLEFEDLVGEVFVEAGFALDSSARRLLGLYELIGLFNSIEWGDELEEDELRPGFFGSANVEYNVRYPCANTPHNCTTGPHNSTLLNVEGAYAVLYHSSQMDAVNGITLDVITNAEWASDQIMTYKAPDRKFSIQYHNELAYHCAEKVLSHNQSAPTVQSAPTWNISSAEKVEEETLPDGTIERHFLIQLYVDEMTYISLVGDSSASAYNGTLGIHYYDNKANAFPRKVVYSNGIEMVFTSYVPNPSLDLTSWELPICFSNDTEVPMLSRGPYVVNTKRRKTERCLARGGVGCSETPRPVTSSVIDPNTNITSDPDIYMGIYGNETFNLGSRRHLLQDGPTCEWTRHDDIHLAGYASGISTAFLTLMAAQLQCVQLQWECRGVTYEGGAYTVRRGNYDPGRGLKLEWNPHGATSFVKSAGEAGDCKAENRPIDATEEQWVMSTVYGSSCDATCGKAGMVCDESKMDAATTEIRLDGDKFDQMLKLSGHTEGCKSGQWGHEWPNSQDLPVYHNGRCYVSPWWDDPPGTCSRGTGLSGLRMCYCSAVPPELDSTHNLRDFWLGKTVTLESYANADRYLVQTGDVFQPLTTSSPMDQWTTLNNQAAGGHFKVVDNAGWLSLQNVKTGHYVQITADNRIIASTALQGWERMSITPTFFGGDDVVGLYSVWHGGHLDVRKWALMSAQRLDGNLPPGWRLETFVVKMCNNGATLSDHAEFRAGMCVTIWHPDYKQFIHVHPDWNEVFIGPTFWEGRLPEDDAKERFIVVDTGDNTFALWNEFTKRFLQFASWGAMSTLYDETGANPRVWERMRAVPSPGQRGRLGLWSVWHAKFLQFPTQVNSNRAAASDDWLMHHDWAGLGWRIKEAPSPEEDCPATCYGATCDQLVERGNTCYWLEQMGCDCGKCSKCSSSSPTSFCSLNCPGEEGEGTCDCQSPIESSIDLTDEISLDLEWFTGCQGLTKVTVTKTKEDSPIDVYGFCEGVHTSMCQVEENNLKCGLGFTYHMEKYLLKNLGAAGKMIQRILDSDSWIQFEATLGASIAFDGTELEVIGLGNLLVAVVADFFVTEVTVAGIDLNLELKFVWNFPEDHKYFAFRAFGELTFFGMDMDFEENIF